MLHPLCDVGGNDQLNQFAKELPGVGGYARIVIWRTVAATTVLLACLITANSAVDQAVKLTPEGTQAPCAVSLVIDQGGGQTPSWHCARNQPRNGLEVLEQAGRVVSFRPGFPGMVCQIDNWPDPCNGAPADAYWSYWRAEAGAWVYQSTGAASSIVNNGDVEGWAFGAGQPPRVEPNAAAEANWSNTTTAAQLTADQSPSWAGAILVILVVLAVCIVIVIRLKQRSR
ncbi:MAG: hypothetical protein LBG70_04540 [Bifidobacteriaceae bacterium]|jgi:hypothetical protein|nr:hypothetical protein [Bifidobacteriaceae bacterium]